MSQIKTGCFSFIESLEIDSTFMVLAEQLEENLKTLDGLRAINIFYLLLSRTSEKILRCAIFLKSTLVCLCGIGQDCENNDISSVLPASS